MLKSIRITISIISTVALMSALSLTAWAGMGGFNVMPILPENHNPASRGFFDLTVTPAQQQRLEIEIENARNESIEITVSTLTAGTSEHGHVEYADFDLVFDESIQHPFSEISFVGADNPIVIPPESSVYVPIYIDIPPEGFDGIILGSVHILLGLTEEDIEQAGMFLEQFAHVIPVRLRENDNPIGVDFTLGNVEATLINYRVSIISSIHHPMPRLTTGVQAHARIYPAGSNTPIFERANINIDFAPNSIFRFTMTDEAGYGILAGDYIAVIELVHEGVTWNFEREFAVEAEEAVALNEAAINIQQAPPQPQQQHQLGGIPIHIILAAASALLMMISVIIALSILKSKKNTQKEMMQMQIRMQEQMLRQQELLAQAAAGQMAEQVVQPMPQSTLPPPRPLRSTDSIPPPRPRPPAASRAHTKPLPPKPAADIINTEKQLRQMDDIELMPRKKPRRV